MLAASFLAMSVEALPLTQGQWDFIPKVVFGGVALLVRFTAASFAIAPWVCLSTSFHETLMILPGTLCVVAIFVFLSVVRERGLKSWQAITSLVVICALTIIWADVVREHLITLSALGAMRFGLLSYHFSR